MDIRDRSTYTSSLESLGIEGTARVRTDSASASSVTQTPVSDGFERAQPGGAGDVTGDADAGDPPGARREPATADRHR